MSFESCKTAPRSKSGLNFTQSGQLRLHGFSAEPRSLQLISHTASASPVMPMSKYPGVHMPVSDIGLSWVQEDVRVSQPQLRHKQQRLAVSAEEEQSAPRSHPAGWSQLAESIEQLRSASSQAATTEALRLVAEGRLMRPYPEIAARLVSPPRNFKSDSPPPGLRLKAVRETRGHPLRGALAAARAEAASRPDGVSRAESVGDGGYQDEEKLRLRRRQSSGPPAPIPRHRAPSQERYSPGRNARLSAAALSRGMMAGRPPSGRAEKDGADPPAPPSSPQNKSLQMRPKLARPTSASRSRPNSRTNDSPASSTAASRGHEPSRPSRPLSGHRSRRSTAHLGTDTMDAVTGPPAEASTPSGLCSGWVVHLASSSSSSSKKKETKREIRLLQSVFEGRPPVVYFDYEPECGAPPRDSQRVIADEDLKAEGFENGVPKMYFAHEKGPCKDAIVVHEYNAVMNTLRQGGLHRTATTSSKWALLWGAFPAPDGLRQYHRFQKTNHFPAAFYLGRKDLLWRSVYKMKRQFPQQFNIMPTSYVMPDDFTAWVAERDKSPNVVWIYKPASLSCGKGIKLLTGNSTPKANANLSQKSGVVQRYVDRPMQINGFKYDLRVYVVVTSYDPLKIYMNTDGLVRLATEKYEKPTADNMSNRTMHLTNYSVNKHSDSYVKNMDIGKDTTGRATPVDAESGDEGGKSGKLSRSSSRANMSVKGSASIAEEPDDEADEDPDALGEEEGDGCGSAQQVDASASAAESKWSFGQLRAYCEDTGQDYNLLMSRVKDLVVKTLISAEPTLVNSWHQGANYSTSGAAATQLGPNQTCFELYGFDVMLDDKLKPWLLEVNTFPSIASSSPLDKRVKTMLIADMLTVAGIYPFDHDLVERAMKEDKMSRLQGINQKHLAATRSHTIHTVSAAPLKDLGESEWQLIIDTHDEYMRRGQLERIYPTQEAVEKYAPYVATPRYSNLVLARWLQAGGENCFAPERRHELPPWVPKMRNASAC